MTILLMALACAPTAPPEPAPEAAAELPPDPMAVSVHTLDNGLTVYLSENHEEARVSARISVRAGGAQDPDDATGMAHYLEHMLANKGSRRLGTLDYEAEAPHLERIRALFDQLGEAPDDEAFAAIYAALDAEGLEAQRYVLPNELKQVYGLLGARGLNAFTNHDSTQYVNDIPANALTAWATLEGDRFSAPVFRAFQTEVETVYEEKNRSMDNPGRAIGEAMSAALFGDHPYGRPVLGTIEHLKRPSISKTEAYFERWYVPDNMAVILAGDFDSAEALALIEEHLGGLTPAGLEREDPPPPAPLAGEVRVEVVHNDLDYVGIAWPTVAVSHPDAEALIVADMLLANGSTGFLDRLEQDQRVRSASSFPAQRRLAGYQQIYGTPREGQTVEELEALLLEQVERLKAGEFSQEDLDAILTNFRVNELRGLESNDARVSRLASAFINELDWDTYRTRLDRMAAVDRERVMAVAQQYLGEGRVVGVRRQGEPELPKIEAPPITERPLNTAGHSAFFQEVLAIQAPALAPQALVEGEHYARFEGPAATIYAGPNPFSDLASLTLRWEVGRHQLPALCHGLALWERSGVGGKTLADIEREIYAAGASISTSCGDLSASVTLSGPQQALPALAALVVARLEAPALAESERAAWEADLVVSRQARKATQGTRLSALSAYARQGEESSWLGQLDDEALAALSTAELLAAPAKLLEYPRTVFYVGNADRDAVLALLPGGGDAPLPERPAQRYVEPAEDRVLFLHHESVQASLYVFIPDELYDPGNYPLYAAWRSYVGGSAGLVFQEIREARGWAYSATGSYSEGGWEGDQNLAWSSATVQADKAVEAAKLLVALTRGLELDPERYARAIGTAAQANRSLRSGFREVPGKAWAWDRVGLPGDARVGWDAALSALEQDALQGFADRWDQRPLTLVVMGDRGRLDLAGLEAIAPVEELTLDQLFSY